LSDKEVSRLLKIWRAEVSTLNLSTSISLTMAQPYAIKLLDFDLQLLGTMVLLQLGMAGVGYVFGSILLSLFRSRRIIFWKLFGTLHRCLWALAGFTHFLPKEYGASFFLTSVAVAQFSGSLAGIASGDVGADIVSKERALKFYSSLNSLGLASNSAGLIITTAIFSFLPSNEGYLVAYTLSMSSAVASSVFLNLLRDPNPPSKGSVSDVLRGFNDSLKDQDSNSYIITVTLFTLAVNLPGALWNYYLLTVIKGAETWVTLKAIAANISQSIGFRVWGRISRKLGLKRTLYVSIALTSPIPAVFTFLYTLEGQVALEMYSGFVWAGYNLANNIYTLYLPKRTTRVYFIAVINATSNVIASATSRLGAQIASISLGAMNAVFYSSTAGRLLLSLIAKRKAPELLVS